MLRHFARDIFHLIFRTTLLKKQQVSSDVNKYVIKMAMLTWTGSELDKKNTSVQMFSAFALLQKRKVRLYKSSYKLLFFV